MPICAGCKKIRDDSGYWQSVEGYLQSNTEINFSHGICPECTEKLYPEFVRQQKARENAAGEDPE